MRDDLYYADPCALVFDLQAQVLQKSAALLHDYGLYEFTILDLGRRHDQTIGNFWERRHQLSSYITTSQGIPE